MSASHDGSAPGNVADDQIADIVEAKRYWIYKNLAEWRDLDATRLVREYRNGEGIFVGGVPARKEARSHCERIDTHCEKASRQHRYNEEDARALFYHYRRPLGGSLAGIGEA